MEKLYALEVQDLYKSFPGVQALKGIQFQLGLSEVHALVGENGAGKSTLMKCLFGIEQPDSGDIFIDGSKMQFKNSSEALAAGISMIHQELHPIPYRTVAENIWLGRYPTHFLPGVVDENKMNVDTQKLFDFLNISINPKTLVANLSVSQIQMMEIAKAISYKAKIIFMDEPTSSLTDNEVIQLFKMIRSLKQQGVSIVYVSHKMEEIKEICDAVTIMRDGEYIGRWNIDELSIDEIISKMVGRQLGNRFPEKTYQPQKEPIMHIKDFESRIPNSFKKLSFVLNKGEILGIGGLVGAQRTELIESIFGLRPAKGEIIIKGEKKSINNSIDAINSGLALLTEERRTTGILGCLSIEHNVMIASYPKLSFKGFITNNKKNLDATNNYINKLNIKTPHAKSLIANLSGGNQQKALIARWLLTDPDILILDEPTRGIDVGAKYEVYNLMYALAAEGKSIIMISSEMPELMGVSDRIMVMSNGFISGIIEKEEFDQEKIMALATAFL
ncbi:monosaccharide ABC transporter ATP-binding protein, CUT2 family (TC 3.A.1.2.-) [Brevinema andersonii]|uniref:Ribose/galactose/methyl galactoside import ATP-binding protein n=1 Tax=Brevinema andersonii TaxID=34097 RepID=A0A1I1D5T1_BREAD|nr:sugar ABC transporter ATP-binding protein [Brevinema andersonii]SFB70379.1 monosaccharide ABC transporter ATP-binding protein, CUT2 family (TC 3.A.1.2.-) [Brevinema andersonii]